MNLKESIARAMKLAREQKQEMVVGKEDERWTILPVSDSMSDSLSPSILITKKGIKYPEDHEKVTKLVSEGE